MKQNNIVLRNKYPIISFVMSLFMILFFYIINNISPFGDQTILCSDLFHQYAPFLAELSEKLTSGESLIYSVGNGLGATFIGNFFNYACSPFNLIVLIFGKKHIQASIAIIIALKVSLSAFTSSYVFKKITKNHSLNITIFGFLYAFSAFFISFYWNIMWYDAVYMLPILIYGIYKLINEKKCGIYIFALSYTIITNYYMGYMLCIASVISFLYFYFLNYSIKQKEIVINKNNNPTSTDNNQCKEKNIFINRCLIFAIASIVSALIACVSLLPIYDALQWSSATSDSMKAISLDFSPLEFITSHFALTSITWRSGAHFGVALPNIYCGVLTLLMIPLYFLNKNINKKEKIISGILISIFYLSFAFNLFNFIWHGFHFPNDIPYRFSYIYCFFLTFIALESFLNIEGLSKKKIILTTIISCLLVAVLGLLFAPNKTILTIPFNIVLMLIFGLIVNKVLKNKTLNMPKPTNVLSFVLCCIVIVEIGLPYMNSFITYKEDLLLTYQDEIDDAKELISEKEDSFYRMELLKNKTMNDSALYNYNGITTFSSMNYSHTSLLQKYLGLSANGLNSYAYKLQPPLYNMMFGLNYIIDNSDIYEINKNYYTKIGETTSGCDVYESNFKTDIGFASINDLSDPETLNYQTYSPFKNQNNIVENITGVSDLITHTNNFTYKTENMEINYQNENNPNNEFKYKITGDREKANTTITTKIEETGNYYAYIVSNNFDVIYNIPDKEEIVQLCTTSYIYALDLGILEAGESFDAKVCVSNKTKDEGSFNYFVCKVNDDAVLDAYNKIKENGILKVTDYSDSHITATINSKTDFIYTSIPYDNNWKITIDGKEATQQDVKLVANSLIGLNVKAGQHTITFEYKQPTALIGLLISLSTLIVVLIVYGIKYYKGKKRNV